MKRYISNARHHPTHSTRRNIYKNLLARLISPLAPEPPEPPWFFIYILRAISAAELTADCLSPDCNTISNNPTKRSTRITYHTTTRTPRTTLLIPQLPSLRHSKLNKLILIQAAITAAPTAGASEHLQSLHRSARTNSAGIVLLVRRAAGAVHGLVGISDLLLVDVAAGIAVFEEFQSGAEQGAFFAAAALVVVAGRVLVGGGVVVVAVAAAGAAVAGRGVVVASAAVTAVAALVLVLVVAGGRVAVAGVAVARGGVVVIAVATAGATVASATVGLLATAVVTLALVLVAVAVVAALVATLVRAALVRGVAVATATARSAVGVVIVIAVTAGEVLVLVVVAVAGAATAAAAAAVLLVVIAVRHFGLKWRM